MIRSDREVTDFQDIVAILSKCEVCHLALNDPSGFPYVLPVNFGYKTEDEHLTLFFHSALKGKKLDLIRADNRASFAAEKGTGVLSNKERGYCTMNYESVIGQGRISFVEAEQEKIEALTILTDRFHPEGHFEFSHAALPRTVVYKLEVESLTGKRKESKV